VLRKDKVAGDLPSLPAVLKSHFRGSGPVLLSYKMCVDRTGQVSTVQKRRRRPCRRREHHPDAARLALLPKPFPVCFIETFSFVID